MSENSGKDAPNISHFVRASVDIQFSIISDNKKLKILTFKEQEQDILLAFLLDK